MISAPPPDNESERLSWLQALDILDTFEEQAYDDLTRLAAQICDTPIALVSLIDRDRQWFKSHYGLAARETPREQAFCAHAIRDNQLFIIEDSETDERFHDNPLATGAPHVKFYAGMPLEVRDGVCLGTLCVIDTKPRTLTPDQKAALEALARQVVSQLMLRQKVKELEKLDQAKDEFVSMVSHELRTPLTSIKGALSLLLDAKSRIPDAQQQEMTQIASRNADRLLSIVNDILDVTKLEAGKLDLHQDRLNVSQLVERAIELNAPFCAQCHCRLDFTTPTIIESLTVNGDEQRLLQVMANLISNAAKFSPHHSVVKVSARPHGDRIRISVTDQGPGISPGDEARVFQRFSQLHNRGNNKLPGTGLGLNICKHIVESHGGSIGFASVPHQATTFYFTLPLLRETAPA
jgi:signal transduction histidine kinase